MCIALMQVIARASLRMQQQMSQLVLDVETPAQQTAFGSGQADEKSLGNPGGKSINIADPGRVLRRSRGYLAAQGPREHAGDDPVGLRVPHKVRQGTIADPPEPAQF